MKKRFAGVIIALLCLVTVCDPQAAAPKNEAAQTAGTQQDAVPQEAASAALAEQASEPSAGQASEPSAEQAAEAASYGMYEDERGWYVLYEPTLFNVEAGKDDVTFHYTGEAVGENYVELRYIADKQPREVLTAEVEGLMEEQELDDDAVVRDEGYLFEDSWGYTAVAEYSDDERDVTVQYQSAEYNGGVFLTKMVEGLTDENILEGYMGDAMWQILDSLTFYSCEPQEEFYYVPGVYSFVGSSSAPEEAEDADTAAEAEDVEDGDEDGDDAEDDEDDAPEAEGFDFVPCRITLKKDHTGSFVYEDTIPVIWGSCLVTAKNTQNSCEYDVEGDSLYLHLNGEWIEYEKTEEIEESENRLLDPEYVKEIDRAVDALYGDGPGKIGRIHKMQAFILELALHAKTQNPDFKVIVQNAPFLAYNDGMFENGDQSYMRDLVDGYGAEGIVGKGESLAPSVFQNPYIDQVKKGKFVSDTTRVDSEDQLDNYLARAGAWGIIPYPKLGGELAQEILPGRRWADNGDYFWVENPSDQGTEDRFDGKRDVLKLTDAQNFLYNINSRPYDNWQDWDEEEEAFEKGDGDRTRITDSYSCGLLVPSEGGKYAPVSDEDDEEALEEITDEYGDKWDWWWREAGLDENAGRETWLDAIRNSDYDVVYIDSFYNHRARPEDQTPLTPEEVESLKTKPDGGRRQVIAYLAIGTAEQNRWYCQDDWIWVDPKNKNSFYSMKAGKVIERGTNTIYVPFKDSASARLAENTAEPPSWLAFDFGDEYPEEAVVQWWSEDWRNIIINGGSRYAHKTTGDNTSSIDRILAQGFDGVYLDNADCCTDSNWDAFEDYWMDHGGIPE